jgi:hypothetical protein
VSIPIALEELAEALARRSDTAYLLTVGDDGRTHCIASTLEWVDDEIVVAAGTTSVRNADARGVVVLLVPPATGLVSPATSAANGQGDDSLGAYSLIVDADVTGTSARSPAAEGPASSLRVRPTHAVFHRPAPSSDGRDAHDCVHVYDEDPSKA